MVLSGLRWVANYENNRWFLVVQIQKPLGDQLNKLLETSNKVARNYKQPCLYVSQDFPAASSRTPKRYQAPRPGNESQRGFVHSRPHDYSRLYKDASAHFHVSIGWTLKQPSEALTDEKVGEQVLRVSIQSIKVKVGNEIAVISLASKMVESNGIVGL